MPRHKENPADRLRGDGAEGDHENANSLHNPAQRFGQELELIADWKDDLRARIARTRLRHELIGVSPEDILSLAEEVRDFRRVCRCLAWSAP
jgi:hypothetical protein